MPTVGPFHRFYWKARANPVTPPGVSANGLRLFTPVASAIGIHVVWFGPPLDLVRTYWRRLLRWLLPAEWRAALALGQRLEGFDHEAQERLLAFGQRLQTFDPEQRAVVSRVLHTLESPIWNTARTAVRLCARTPKFHQPEQWVEYSRAIKGNIGQAQNVFRHLKAVQAVRGLQDGPAAVSNPEAHLIVELAYQGFAAIGR